MSGIYIHIPYCANACIYCNFHFSTSVKHRDSFIGALHKEIIWQKAFFDTHESIQTLYFGGGTPSIIADKHIEETCHLLHKYFSFEKDFEFTIEANPEDLSRQKLQFLKNMGVNRLNIGVQSFDDKNLRFLKRVHNAKQALNSIKTAQEVGFENITIDLIYGIPTQTLKSWESDIATFLSLQIPHLSTYALTVERKTPLAVMIDRNILPDVNEKASIELYNSLTYCMSKNNYKHYEISNFALEGIYSKHNMLYWTGKKYLGLGPSAHSYNGMERFWNIANTSMYIEKINNGEKTAVKELLSQNMRFNEYIFTSLRTMWGVEWAHVEKNYDAYCLAHLKSEVGKMASKNWLEVGEKGFKLSAKGKLFADRAASELFIV